MRQYRICMTSQWGEQKETINALSWLTRDMADSGRRNRPVMSPTEIQH